MAVYNEAPKVGFFQAVKLYFVNYVNFKGRSRRSEFWWVYLFNILVSILFALVIPEAAGIWTLVTLIPGLSLNIRRLHDTGHNGWYLLVNLIPLVGWLFLLVWYCTDSAEDNQWGPDPKRSARIVEEGPAMNGANGYTPQAPAAAIPLAAASQTASVTYTPDPPTAAEPPVQSHPAQSYVTLYLYSGPMAGTSFRNPAGSTLILGRNPAKCDVVLNQYNVVSGVHCQISLYDQYITVQDLNSTNGTYVNNQRLTPGTPVSARNGSTIYLANSGCAFQVRFE